MSIFVLFFFFLNCLVVPFDHFSIAFGSVFHFVIYSPSYFLDKKNFTGCTEILYFYLVILTDFSNGV